MPLYRLRDLRNRSYTHASTQLPSVRELTCNDEASCAGIEVTGETTGALVDTVGEFGDTSACEFGDTSPGEFGDTSACEFGDTTTGETMAGGEKVFSIGEGIVFPELVAVAEVSTVRGDEVITWRNKK